MIEKLNGFEFLNAIRVISAEDFITRIEKKTISNNLILICSKQMENEIIGELVNNQYRMNKVKGIIVYHPDADL
jgi:hypothetical protein